MEDAARKTMSLVERLRELTLAVIEESNLPAENDWLNIHPNLHPLIFSGCFFAFSESRGVEDLLDTSSCFDTASIDPEIRGVNFAP